MKPGPGSIFLVFWLVALVSCGRGEQPLSVVLISIDTLAARHLGLYGYERDTAPNLRSFAQNAIVFSQAYSTAPKTAESHMSMFTSLYPSVHGVFTVQAGTEASVLDEGLRTLPEILRDHGYATVGFHSGGHVAATLGFGRGFDSYENKGRLGAARSWVKKHGGDGKFFLFAHTYWVHDPYTPEAPFDRLFTDHAYDGSIIHSQKELEERGGEKWGDQHQAFWDGVEKDDPEDVAHLAALYDGLIAEMDVALARLLSAIDRHAPRTIVILLSDHGEEFAEHGRFMHDQLYDEVLHVPLIIRHPERPGGRVDGRVSLIDLAPTILDLLSLPPIEQFQGRSLVSHIEQEGDETAVFSEFPGRGLRSVTLGGKKLIVAGGDEEYYDLAADPGELRDLSDVPERSTEFQELRTALGGILASNDTKRSALAVSAATQELDGDTLEQLKALGYLDE